MFPNLLRNFIISLVFSFLGIIWFLLISQELSYGLMEFIEFNSRTGWQMETYLLLILN